MLTNYVLKKKINSIYLIKSKEIKNARIIGTMKKLLSIHVPN